MKKVFCSALRRKEVKVNRKSQQYAGLGAEFVKLCWKFSVAQVCLGIWGCCASAFLQNTDIATPRAITICYNDVFSIVILK